jgi:AcrR family transcriptional regulator
METSMTTVTPPATKTAPDNKTSELRRPSQRNAQLEQRCQRFVEVAEELFLQHGFAGTSVNKVVAIAGGSLATLYAEFRNKEELFEAVMKRRASRLFVGVIAEPVDNSIEELLLNLGQRLMDFMLSDQSLSFYRLVVNEGPRFPGVRNAVYQNGWEPFFMHLAERFNNLSSKHKWTLDDPRVAAELFVTLIQGQMRTLGAWGLADQISQDARHEHVRRSVRQFLTIYPTQGS